MSDLVERLRKVESSCTREPTTHWYRNPDGPEAADQIERLQQRIGALRGALQGMLDGMALEHAAPRYDVYQVEREAVQQARDILTQDLMEHRRKVAVRDEKDFFDVLVCDWLSSDESCEYEARCALLDEAAGLQARLANAERELDITHNMILNRRDEIERLKAENANLRAALEMIAGKRPCVDGLMSNVDIARAALGGHDG